MIKINEFVKINELTVESKFVTCAGCKQWLSIPILLHSDGANYCEPCSKKEKSTGIRNFGMEKCLGKFLFPCIFKNCDCIERLDTIHEHVKACFYGSLKCIVCKEDIEDGEQIVTHLGEKHVDLVTRISIDEPVAVLNFNMPLATQKIFMVDFKSNTEIHTFVIFVQFITNSSSNNNGTLEFTVGKLTGWDANMTNDKFLVQYQCNEKEIKARGNIINLVRMFKSTTSNTVSKSTIALADNDSNTQEIALKVYFYNFELVETLIDPCPICFHRLTAEVHLCSNGHSVCSKCITNVTDCGICRTAMNGTKVDLKRILPQIPFRCPNAEAGCVNFVKENELDKHLADCLYHKVMCHKCDKDCLKHNIMNHMQEEHKVWPMLTNLFYKVNASQELLGTTDYVKFNNQIFCVKRKYDSGHPSRVTFTVQLLYHGENEAQKYQYQIQILDEKDARVPIYTITNKCQSMSDDSDSSILNNYRNYIHESEQIFTFRFRYFIYEIKSAD